MGKKRNRRHLEAAWEAGDTVSIRRTIWKADQLEGYVVDLSDEWLALHLVVDVGLNGWSVVRLDTVREVEREDVGSFVGRALALFGHEPEPVPVELRSAVDVVRSLATTFPVLSVMTEAEDPLHCAIGHPVRAGRKALHLQEISSDATWEPDATAIPWDDITRVDVGGRYEQALHALGGYPPVPD